ncbi:MAG: hypothetical protein KDC66_07225 [Phaeodactylibacter sp.]|nr:hypothetical protein [Phaeodactylibacter sp.]MCB9276568.1 hypothetical protein [Lewinellaceae bacterium]
MTESKLIDALKQLPTRERTRYRELAFSPFFNKNQKVRRLAVHLLKTAPSFEGPALEKDAVFKAVFGKGKTYDEYRLNNVISDALQLLYEFLAQLRMESEGLTRRTMLAEELLGRRLERHLPHALQRNRQLLELEQSRSMAFFLHEHRLAGQLDRFALLRETRSYTQHLQEMNDALDRYYWCNKLRLACDMASRNQAINAGYQCHFLDAILEGYRQGPAPLSGEPALEAYFTALQMLETETEEHYRALRNILHQQPPLTREELSDLYDYAQNFCVKKINSGQTDYYAEILELYKEMLKHQILLRQGYLTQWSYINIVTAGIRLREFAWTEWFIRTYREQLDPAVRDNVYTYNLAALYFEQGQYHLALQSLQDVEFSDVFYHMAAKLIQLKSYYELNETEAFFSLAEASRKYIHRNRQLSDYQKQSNANFLRLAGKLYQIRLNGGRGAGLNLLNQELDGPKPFANKGWLRGKIGELRG